MSNEAFTTRERILEGAWTLLLDNRPSAVRMSDVAKQAGISRQAVYLHFPSRAELLIATTHYIDKVKDIDGRLAQSRSEGPLSDVFCPWARWEGGLVGN